jgi:Tol biopolymer transport system component
MRIPLAVREHPLRVTRVPIFLPPQLLQLPSWPLMGFLFLGGVAGGALAGGETTLVSVDSSGALADGASFDPSITSSGRLSVFTSLATNLVAGDTNAKADIFVHDRKKGTTARVSVDSAGAEADGDSSDPLISTSGRLAAFDSVATNLVVGDTNGKRDLFVHDLKTGITERVSVDSAGTQSDGDSFNPLLSDKGRFVGFDSDATNLVVGDTNGHRDVFLHDRKTGATSRMSVDSVGAQGDAESSDPSVSSNGRLLAFRSAATNLVIGDTNGKGDIFVHDRKTGVTERVSVNSAGLQTDGENGSPWMTPNGRFVAFESAASNLVAGDTNGQVDVFVRDRKKGITERVSVTTAGAQADFASFNPELSSNGRFVVFQSDATNLVAGDTNGMTDIFVHDRTTGVTERISVDTAGGQADLGGSDAAISSQGRFVPFGSGASNLVAGDTNANVDCFVRKRK